MDVLFNTGSPLPLLPCTCVCCRFDAHIMFSLARGKVCESTARLALAEGMMKVSVWWPL